MDTSAPARTWPGWVNRLSAKILDQHDVRLGEFVLNIHDRAAILRTSQSPTYVTIEIPNRDYFPGSEFQKLHPAEGSLVKFQEVNTFTGHNPIRPLVPWDLS